jgi:hypothetical protein
MWCVPKCHEQDSLKKSVQLDERPSIFIRDNPIFSSEWMSNRIQLEKEFLVLSPKVLDFKTN